MFAQLIKTALDVLRLRAGPQDMPAGHVALQLSIVLFLASYTAAISAFFALGESLVRALLDLVLSVLFVRLLLQFRGFAARFQQTLSALMATGFVLNLVAWPLFLMLAERLAMEPEVAADGGGEILSILFWLLYGWSLVVSAHIYRHALEIRFALGFLLSLGYFFLAYFVSESLLGTGG